MNHNWVGPVSSNMEARADWLHEEASTIERVMNLLVSVLAEFAKKVLNED